MADQESKVVSEVEASQFMKYQKRADGTVTADILYADPINGPTLTKGVRLTPQELKGVNIDWEQKRVTTTAVSEAKPQVAQKQTLFNRAAEMGRRLVGKGGK